VFVYVLLNSLGLESASGISLIYKALRQCGRDCSVLHDTHCRNDTCEASHLSGNDYAADDSHQMKISCCTYNTCMVYLQSRFVYGLLGALVERSLYSKNHI
jgi:hypothetical protein